MDVEAIYLRHVDTVYRVCYSFMGNAADSEDATQSTFVKLMKARPTFTNEEHEKAWLIRVASNHCKDVLKSSVRKGVSDERGPDLALDAVLALDSKYKDVVYLHYYEGYSAADIARMLGKPSSTVRTHLREARAILRKALGGQ